MSSNVDRALPDVRVWGKNPSDVVKLRDACEGQKCVIFGVPGPFTPSCSEVTKHSYDQFKDLGVDLVACVTVSDPFVMTAWGRDQKTEGKIQMWADTQMELTTALDVVLDAKALLGTKRSQRYAMIVENNVIRSFSVEDEPPLVTVSSAESIIEALKNLKTE